jgi:hypothetical protein
MDSEDTVRQGTEQRGGDLPGGLFELMDREIGPTPNTDPPVLKEAGSGKLEVHLAGASASTVTQNSKKRPRTVISGREEAVVELRLLREDMKNFNRECLAQDAAERDRDRMRDGITEKMLLVLEKIADHIAHK